MSDSPEFTSQEIFLRRLLEEYHYPSAAVEREYQTAFGKARFRVDIVVLKAEKPHIMVEVRRTQVTRPQYDSAKDQLASYIMSTGAKLGVASDGYIDNCFEATTDIAGVRLDEIPDIPSCGKGVEDIGHHTNSELISIDRTHLRRIITYITDLIVADTGTGKEQAFQKVLAILLLKAYDEQSEEAMFRIHYREPPENVRSRLIAAAQRSKSAQSDLSFLKDLHPQILSLIVAKLQKYSLCNSAPDVVGSKLPLAHVFGRSRFQFSSPRNLVRLMIELLGPERGRAFLDPACGTGGLLAEAAKRGCNAVGIEIMNDIASIAKANLVLFGLTGEVLNKNSLESAIFDHIPKGTYDYVAVVPPFGARIDDYRLADFVVAESSHSVEALFLERCIQFAKEGGHVAIVLPDGFLFTASAYPMRRYLLERSVVKAIISLPANTFRPYSSVKSSLLLLEVSKRGTSEEDGVFVALVDDIETESIVTKYRNYFDRRVVPREQDVFVTHIRSAEQLAPDYLRHLRLSQEWEKAYRVVELREIADITAGVPIEKAGRIDKNWNAWYVRAGNVGELILRLGDQERIRTDSVERINRSVARQGDILITRAGTVGRAAIVERQDHPIVIGSNVIRISVRTKDVLPEYLLAYLRSKRGSDQISVYTKGSTIPAISTSGIGHIKVPVQSMEKQKRIASKVTELIRSTHEFDRILEEHTRNQGKSLEQLVDLFDKED